ncbi:MAG: Jag N-terminal domain-containing protein, partial [Synergistaceae bacterium]|nr:Jag N-terminal domain-containing protein [Synergistaceae bacterium]
MKRGRAVDQNTHLVFDTTSVEGALEQASRQWGVPSGDLSAEVVGEERGFLGLFGRK